MQAIELFFVNFKGIGPRQVMQKSTSASSSEVTFFCAFFGGRPRFAGGFAPAFFDILRFCGVFEASRFFCFSRKSSRLSGDVKTALFIGRRPRLDLAVGAAACRGPTNDKIEEWVDSRDEEVEGREGTSSCEQLAVFSKK
jgi:hypothetical protein